MEQSFDILVIILSSLLAVFLVIAIVVAVIVYKLVRSAKQVIDKGEHLMNSAGELTETIKQNASAAGLAQLIIRQVAKTVKSKKRK